MQPLIPPNYQTMKDVYKKLTEEIKLQLAKSKENATLVDKTKASEDSGTFDVIISTADQDRQGEVVDIAGWDLENYKSNPIVLWAHDYHQLPIGVADEVKIEGGKLIAKGRFAPMDANPFAQQVRKLYDAGLIKTTSVGFIAKRMEGNVITEAELLEFSFVPVPANPYALSLRQAKEMGIDMAVAKSFNIEIKDEAGAESPANEQETAGDGNAPIDNKDTADEPVEGQEADKNDAGPDTPAQEGTPAAESGDTAQVPEHSEAETTEPGAIETKAGRVLSEKNRQTIQSAIDAMKAAASALEDLMSMTEDTSKGAGGDRQDGDAPNKRSNDMDEALKNWLADRQFLRALNNATSRALSDINRKSK